MENSVAVYKSYKQLRRFKLPQVYTPAVCFVVQYGSPTPAGVNVCQNCHGVLCIELPVIWNFNKGISCSFKFVRATVII